jgi:hypothetical protein
MSCQITNVGFSKKTGCPYREIPVQLAERQEALTCRPHPLPVSQVGSTHIVTAIVRASARDADDQQPETNVREPLRHELAKGGRGRIGLLDALVAKSHARHERVHVETVMIDEIASEGDIVGFESRMPE